jgi:outer membrane receptor protein involved in Fe transport
MLSFVLALSLALAGSSLTGIVRSIDGAPLAGAVVVAQQRGQVLTAITNERGEFSLADLDLPADIEVQAVGFATVRQRVESSPVEITLAPAAIRESVVVSSRASSFSASDVWRMPLTGTTELSGQTMRELPAVTADEALRVVSGLSLFRRSSSRASNPTTHGVTMRGLSASGASRGLVLFDGLPLNDGFGGWVTWTRLPPYAVQTVEIDRGAQGATFGSDAMGGVINVSSPRFPSNAGTVAVSAGSLGVGTADALGTWRKGRVALVGTASWFTTDGAIPTAPESRGPVDVPADAEWFNGFGKVHVEGSRDRFVLSVWGSDDDRGNGTPLQRNRMQGLTTALAWDRVVKSTRVAARASFSPNSYEQTFSAVSAGRVTETLTSTQFVDVATTRLALEAGRIIPRGYVTARVLSSRASADFTDQRTAGTTARSLQDDSDAIAAHVGWAPAGSVTLGAGVRREWRAAPEDGASRDAATVGHASAAWSITGRVVVRGSIASSHRWPTLNELVRNFQVGSALTLANPDLLPERARSGDVAVTFTHPRWSVAAGGFWAVVEDAIANVTVTTTPLVRQRRNAGEAHAKGLELDGEWRPADRGRLRASWVLADSRFRESLEPALEGNRLPQVPRSSFSISGDSEFWRGLSVSAIWRAVSSQFDDDRNVFELAPAHQLDLRVAGRVKSLTWHVSLDNALDNRVEVGRTPLVTLAPERAIRAGLAWTVR